MNVTRFTTAERRIVLNIRTIKYGSGGVQKWSESLYTKLLVKAKDSGYQITTIYPKKKIMGNGLLAYCWEQFYLPIKISKNDILISPGSIGPIFVKNQILTVHDLLPFSHPNEYRKSYRIALKLVYKAIFGKVYAVTTVSELQLKEIMTFSLRVRNVINVGAGPNINLVQDQEKKISDVFQSKDYFLMIGCGINRKNASFLVDIWNTYFQDVGDPRLVLIGRSHIDQSYVFSNVSNVNPNIQVIYDPSDSELVHYYKNCIAVLQPSLGEGFGMPIIEGMSFGKPFLSNDVGVARNAQIGYSKVLNLENEKWRTAILKLFELTNTFDYNQIEKARMFNFDDVAKKTLEIIDAYFESR